MTTDALQAAIVRTLCAAETPLTASQIRQRLSDAGNHPMAGERLYHALLTLHRRALVRRVQPTRSANALWAPGISIKEAG